ncbi:MULTISPECIES: tetratricopeptide repeat protein [Nocardiaceae]|jgi:tetratricopeptide (TPR) repeat protein|uniref:tetratricopeptide repeat protein n=1 Tax=Nocardiaceae TaxID=85025 RepID=UPI001E39FDDC|nr:MULTISPECIES: hypothetical protein [Rhodococcus]MCC8929037.1 hypothetical protein [Rhodococcus sp. I2R]MCZ4278138.1 hypothetical protein [Rhodococcus yunnanensis]
MTSETASLDAEMYAGVRLVEEGRARDGLHVLEQALAGCEQAGDVRRIGLCLRWVGAAHAELGSSEMSIRSLHRAIVNSSSADDVPLEADCRGLLGLVLFDSGHTEDAVEQLRQACALSESCGDIESEANCSSALAEVYEEMSCYEPARTFYQRAAELFWSVHYAADSAENRESAGLCSIDLDESEAARDDFGLACELFAREGDDFAVARCQFLLGVCSVEDDPAGAERNFKAAIAHLDGPEHADLEGDCWEQLGDLYLDAQRVDESFTAFGNALALHERTGRAVRSAHCHKQVGRLHAHLRAVGPAVESFEAARNLYVDVDPGEAVDLDILLGRIFEDLGKYPAAIASYTRARKTSIPLDDDVVTALCDMNTGTVRMHLGDHTTARALLVGAADIFARYGARVEEAQCLRYLSAVQPSTTEQSAELLAKSLRLIDGLGEVELELDCNQDLALVQYTQGNYERAVGEFESVREVFLALGMDMKAGLCLQSVGMCLMSLGRYEKSARALIESRAVFVRHEMPAAVAISDAHLGQLYLDTGRFDDSEHAFRRARQVLETVGAMDRLAMVEQNLGGLYLARGDLDAAELAYSRAHEQFAGLGDSAKSAVCQCNIGAVAFKKEQFARASSLIGQALSRLERDPDQRRFVAWAHRNRACAELAQGNSEQSLVFLGSARRMSKELDALIDVAKCDFMAALCQASVPGHDRLRAAVDLALPALLYLDAQRFQFAGAAARRSWSTTISLWNSHVFKWAHELGDATLLADLIESAINSGTHVSEVSVDAHAALSEVSFSADSDAPTMDVADAVAGVARTLIAGSVLPMRPPPRLSMPGGRIVLGQFLQSVDTRYGLVVRPATVNVA